MTDFIPSYETALECFLDGADGNFIKEDFDAFLDQVRSDALKKGWDEGLITGIIYSTGPDFGVPPNPYEEGVNCG